MIERILSSLLIGVVTFLVSLVVIFVVSAILPGVRIDASFWAGILALLAGLIYLFTGRSFLK